MKHLHILKSVPLMEILMVLAAALLLLGLSLPGMVSG